jgi:hypothetical protein
MKLAFNKETGYWLLRVRNSNYTEVAYATLGWKGLQAEMEIPSDWHEDRRVWFRFGLGIGSVCFSLPWPKSWRVVPDEFQCSGPTYGFQFYEDLLWIRWGKDNGRSKGSPRAAFYMPWAWKHREHRVLSEPESHPYTYVLRSGEVQNRTATIKAEQRTWTRWWLPFKHVIRSIDIEFSDEVGERTGSWKGGCIGCTYTMNPGETPLQALRRMEKERRF